LQRCITDVIDVEIALKAERRKIERATFQSLRSNALTIKPPGHTHCPPKASKTTGVRSNVQVKRRKNNIVPLLYGGSVAEWLADCQEPGSAPEPYAQQSSMGYRYRYLLYTMGPISLRRGGLHNMQNSIINTV